MDIKEIALRIGEEADEYADAKLQSKGEFHPDWHTVRDEYFAEALIAELAKQNKPVAEVLSLFPGEPDSYINARAIGVDPFNTWTFPQPGTKLYTFPPTAEQIANETAWQPIETAPKDGTRILGWCAEFGARETKMNFYGEGSIGHANWKSGKGPRESGWDWTEPKNGWGFSWNPTHWMPLPTPPKQSMEGV